MNDEQTQQAPSVNPSGPTIRDPRAPSNLVRDFEPLDIPTSSSTSSTSSTTVIPPVTSPVVSPVTSPAAPSVIRPTLADVSDANDSGPSAAALRSADDDALAGRPRVSAVLLCVLFGLLFIAAAFGVWWLGAHTEAGQSFDDMAETAFPTATAGWAGALLGFGTHLNVVIGSVLLAVVAVLVAGLRRRWWLMGQLGAFGVLCYAATWLKPVLPRPFIIHTQIVDGPSAPSGHVALAVACSIALLFAVSRGWRWVAALVGMCWSAFVGLSVVYGQWHRPSDAVMAILLVGGIAMIALAFTRASGMDAVGKRRSSAGVQIVASVALTASIMAILYGAYVIWQIVPGLTMSAAWARSSSVAATSILVVATVSLVFGLALAMRQITAAPLTRLGLVGAPPAPPRRRRPAPDHAS